MQCTFSSDGNVLIVAPAGRIDTTACHDFKAALNAKLDESRARHLVIDLAAVGYVSSAGFREFFLVGRRMGHEGGTLSVCSLQPQVREIFEIAQFATSYPMYDKREAAVAAVKAA
jgi:anti-anti-sigma factor